MGDDIVEPGANRKFTHLVVIDGLAEWNSGGFKLSRQPDRFRARIGEGLG